MIDLWLLTTEFPPYAGGGIGTYCEEFVACADAATLRLTVFVSDWSLEDRVVRHELRGHRVLRFNPGIVSRTPGLQGPAQLADAFWRVVAEAIQSEGRPDVIESQDYLGISYFIAQRRLTMRTPLTGVPLAITLHTPEYAAFDCNGSTQYQLPQYWTGEMERFCLMAADALWAPSQKVVDHLGLDDRRPPVDLIRNPCRLPDDGGEEECERQIVYFGRIQRRKGAPQLVQAYAQLVEEGEEAPLLVIGGDATDPITGGAMRQFLERRYRHLVDAGRLRFAGLLPRTEALQAIRRASVVSIPSIFENFPYAALEAMGMRRAVVTSINTGVADVMHNAVDGFLFDHARPDDLRNALRAALALSPSERLRVGARARELVARTCDPAAFLARKRELIDSAQERVRAGAERRTFPFVRAGNAMLPTRTDAPAQTPGPALSIVIPFFNLGDLLEEALASALATKGVDFEIIVLNASSTEASSLAAYYALRERHRGAPLVRFEHVVDRGLADTRNRGAALARGRYLAFLDADDLVAPDYYCSAVNVLARYDNVAAVGCWVKYFGADDGQWITWNAEPPYVLFHNLINSASCVFRRDAFLRIGGNDVGMTVGMEDYETVVRLIGAGFGVVALPEFFFRYRVRANSMMRRLTRDNDVWSYERIARNNAALFERYAVSLAGLLNANGPGYLHDNPLVASSLGQ
ncbi:MAG: glycosyltransferase [Betaproteobacteria bacterium]|jgi:glycogen(starch) synthase